MQIMFKGYLPDWLTQSMFFTKNTSKKVQKEVCKGEAKFLDGVF